MFFGKSFKVGKIGPIPIHIDLSWFFMFALFSYFVSRYFIIGLGVNSIFPLPLILGVITTILFFLSGLGHELAHSFVAIRNGMEVKRITLFLLGMGAHFRGDQLKKAGQEFKIAIAGPLASFAIAGFWYGLKLLGLTVGLTSQPLFLMLNYLIFINILLGVFNLLPGFPMDGGRVLRSAVWNLCKDQIKATRLAVRVGRVTAVLMIAGAIYIGNLFLILIGFLIFSAGSAELKALILQKKLEGKKVRDLMKSTTNREVERRAQDGFKTVFCQAGIGLFEAINLMQANKTVKIFVKVGDSVVGFISTGMIKEFLESEE